MNQEVIDIYNKGYFFYTGTNGFDKDIKQAIKYFEKAAQLGYADAMNYLGLIYENGNGVPKSYQLASLWYIKAINADNKNPFASYNLARMYYNGTGVRKNLDRAYVYAHSSVLLGLGNTNSIYPKSCYLTGLILMEYYKKYRRAVLYFYDAAKYGKIPEAYHNLGFLAQNGAFPVKIYGGKTQAHFDGVAHYFFEEAAKLGFLPSMDETGRLYLKYQDFSKGRYWIEKAAAKGYEPSKKRLKCLKFMDIMSNISSIPSFSHNNASSNIPTPTSDENIKNKSYTFYDANGNYCTVGSPFYDAKGYLCEWGAPFYDWQGNYCTSDSPFYDSKGNYCTPGSPFYDSKGNLISP